MHTCNAYAMHSTAWRLCIGDDLEVVIARDVARVFPCHEQIHSVRLEIAEVLRSYARQALRRKTKMGSCAGPRAGLHARHVLRSWGSVPSAWQPGGETAALLSTHARFACLGPSSQVHRPFAVRRSLDAGLPSGGAGRESARVDAGE